MTQEQLKNAAAELEAARDHQPGRPPAAAQKATTQKAKKASTKPRSNTDSTGTVRNP
jgi:hypothetical protein